MKNSNRKYDKKANSDRNCRKSGNVRGVDKFDSYDRTRGSHDNDPSWYAANPELLKDVATLSFPYAVGMEVPVAEVDTFSTAQWNSMAQPGIMSFHYYITPGISNDATSAVNVAAINLYSYVRHANSGHTNYESADLMQYILCMDWLYAWYAELVRAYGVARTYSFKNRYMPKVYLKALGFNPDDIINNLANLRYYINYLCVRLGAFAVPSNFSYMARHIWMSSHLWADAPGNRFQTYAYRLGDYGYYSPYTDQKGGEIRRAYGPVAGLTMNGIEGITAQMLDPIITNEDFGIMSGDILKAFGTNIVSLSPITEDYTVTPEFNIEVLEQIHNTTVGVFKPGWIAQENGVIKTQQESLIDDLNINWEINPAVNIKKYLDMFTEYPDPGDVMVATRNMVAFEKQDNTKVNIVSCGSEAIVYASIWVYNYEADELRTQHFDVDFINYEASAEWSGPTETLSNVLGRMLNIRSLAEQFAYHPPFIYILENTDAATDSTTLDLLGKSWDTTNVTEISANTLRKLHDTALMSQFNVPSMGAFALSR